MKQIMFSPGENRLKKQKPFFQHPDWYVGQSAQMGVKKKEKAFHGQKDSSKGILYYLAAIYIGYMGYSIMHNRLNGDDTLSYPLAVFLTSVFVIGAVFIFWYAAKLKKSRMPENETQDGRKEPLDFNQNNGLNSVMNVETLEKEEK